MGWSGVDGPGFNSTDAGARSGRSPDEIMLGSPAQSRREAARKAGDPRPDRGRAERGHRCVPHRPPEIG
ncbi:uncharacterized protein SOCE836_105120 [Sorangium cellulosum]|uniref:Uncharacterized protein n=1 Tax=Sorangium cellulosum TaxID=56 RepID=A0A4P2R6D5_SORCE|nr:uncharacterized protein SOCE836_105120 [Sorangium cellulosum]